MTVPPARPLGRKPAPCFYAALAILALSFTACDTAGGTDEPKVPDGGSTDTEGYVGEWESFFGDILVLRADGSYEFGLSFMDEVTYKEKGTYVVQGSTITFVKTHELEFTDQTTWLPADFDSTFARDRTEYNAYLETLTIDPVETADEWWAINYEWAQTSQGGYAGYIPGMTLEQYITAARNTYTESLTWNTPWTLEHDELTITYDGRDYFFDSVTAG